MEIRKILPKEKSAAPDLVWRVFLKFEAPQYPAEGAKFFREYLDNDEATSALDIYGAFDGKRVVGVLAMRNSGTHVSLFFVDEEYHRLGIGRALFEHNWERKMAEFGYGEVMTSTASDEYAQHFYNKLGYMTVGGFTPSGDPFELILSKRITQNGAAQK